MKKISLLIAFFSLWPAISFGAVITFDNNEVLTFDLGPASIYPSTIEVSGLADVLDVNVTLSGLTHSWPEDLWVALVGPTGAKVVLMANAGMNRDGDSLVDDIDLIFDDEATSMLPLSNLLISGTYQVSQYESLNGGSGDPVNGGADPTPSEYFTFGTNLSTFDGLNPNGIWSLYVFDDCTVDSGFLSGWTLSLEATPVPLPGAALLLGAGLIGLVALPRKRR